MSQPRCSPCGCPPELRSYKYQETARCLVHDVDWRCTTQVGADGRCERGHDQPPQPKPGRKRSVRIDGDQRKR